MFYKPRHRELSNLPKVHDWPSQCHNSNSGRSLRAQFVTTNACSENEASLCELYVLLPPFCSLRAEFSLWIFIQRKSLIFIDNLNSQYSSYFCLASLLLIISILHEERKISRDFMQWNNLGCCLKISQKELRISRIGLSKG